jgi:hypothetical protein
MNNDQKDDGGISHQTSILIIVLCSLGVVVLLLVLFIIRRRKKTQRKKIETAANNRRLKYMSKKTMTIRSPQKTFAKSKTVSAKVHDKAHSLKLDSRPKYKPKKGAMIKTESDSISPLYKVIISRPNSSDKTIIKLVDPQTRETSHKNSQKSKFSNDLFKEIITTKLLLKDNKPGPRPIPSKKCEDNFTDNTTSPIHKPAHLKHIQSISQQEDQQNKEICLSVEADAMRPEIIFAKEKESSRPENRDDEFDYEDL